jgi:hypothetical protein
MPFSEALKLEVKRKSAFQCCRCREIGIDIHHIIPQAQGGSDDIDNAAPLCQNCHDRFGANPEKRKEIRQMRDWWYEVVQERYHESRSQFEKLNETILKIQDAQERGQSEISQLRTELIAEIREFRPIRDKAIADIAKVPAGDLARQANVALFSIGTIQVMGMPETLRRYEEKEQK